MPHRKSTHIQLFEAVVDEELLEFCTSYALHKTRQGSGAIFFSSQGDKLERAPADKLSNGDYDGDMFWCCWNEKLTALQYVPTRACIVCLGNRSREPRNGGFRVKHASFSNAMAWIQSMTKDHQRVCFHCQPFRSSESL